MRLRWTVPAAQDLESIRNYLESQHPSFAEPTVRTIYRRIRALKTSPGLGRPGRRIGTRELALTPLPYIVVYLANTDTIEILHIHHGAQDWWPVEGD
jgi:toxin ParE1/3/4